jgi:hypothetical protein
MFNYNSKFYSFSIIIHFQTLWWAMPSVVVILKLNITGVVWAYFLCCWASKSSCILFFMDLGKKIGWAPPVSPSWPVASIFFLVNYCKPNNSFLGHNFCQRLLVLFFLVGIIESLIGATTSCFQWMLPRKNFFWNIEFYYNLVNVSQKLMKYKEKTLI